MERGISHFWTYRKWLFLLNLWGGREKCSAIERIVRFGRDRFALLIGVLAGLGTAHILVRTATYGPAVGHDSTLFLSTAINFLAGEGWRDFWDRPLVGWPPLFPLGLAAGGWVGIAPLEAGRWINATAFGLTILAAGCWLRSNLRSRGLALAATGAIAASLPLSEFASTLLTEPLFVLLTLLALIQLASFLQRGGRTPLWWAAVFTALAALTRWPGVVLIGAGVLLLGWRTPPLAARLKDAVVFGAVSSLPLAVVLTRNWAISGTLTGKRERRQSLSDVSDGLSQVVDVFQEWVIPPDAPDGLLLWTAAGLVGAAGLGAVGLNLRLRPGSLLLGLGPALPFGGFALAYLLFIVAVVPFMTWQEIDSRYLLPVYVPLLSAAVLLLDRFLSIAMAGRMAVAKSGLKGLVLLAALAHIGFSAHRNLCITTKALEFGFGFGIWKHNTSYWASSETLNYIRLHLREGRIYSNRMGLAWFWDRTAAPGKHQRLPRKSYKVMPHIMRQTAGDDVYLVYIGNIQMVDDDRNLRGLPDVEPVAELADGVVFRMTTGEPCCAKTTTKPFNADRSRARRQRYVNQLIQQADEQVIRAGWHVYRTGRTLVYRKKPCAPADVQAKFVLDVYPVDPADLPAYSRQYGFDNLDFNFNWLREHVDDECMVLVRLPAYAIDRIRIAQLAIENRILWEAEFSPSR